MHELDITYPIQQIYRTLLYIYFFFFSSPATDPPKRNAVLSRKHYYGSMEMVCTVYYCDVLLLRYIIKCKGTFKFGYNVNIDCCANLEITTSANLLEF